MDQWRKKPLREERTKNPSFSSTLLDTIYRSIEEEEEHMVMYRETTKKKQSHSGSNQNMLSSSTTSNYSFEEEEVENLKRIEKWMEKKVTSDKEQVDIFFNQKQHHAHRRQQQQQQLGTLKLDDDDDDDCYNKMAEDEIDHLVFHSNSSSSDSSFYGFSSSEMESWPSASYRSRPRSEKVSRSDDCSSRKTINMVYDHDYKRGSDATAAKNAKLSSGSRALKMYRDLKMKNSSNKPPISPGRRLATFLNSIFTSTRGNGNGNGNGNNANSKVNNKVSSSQSQPTTTTASSFSRSCLSKTPNSTGKKIRSVRFYPVSVILDEDSQPCGHKSLDPEYKVMTTDQQQQLQRFHLMEKNRRIEEAAKDLLLFRNYEKKKISHHHRLGIRESDEDDDDSDSSTSSSDLFELDHLSAGLERRRYREELPVYETTHLRTNRAISNRGYLL